MLRITHVITTIERGGAEKQLLILVDAQVKHGHVVDIIFLKGKPELERELFGRGVNAILDLSSDSFLVKITKLRNKFKLSNQIIHCHLPRAEIFAVISNLFLITPILITRHNAENFFPTAPRRISSLLSKLTTSRVKFCIAISDSVAQFIKSEMEISKKCEIRVIHYGFVGQIPQHFKSDQSQATLQVGTVSRLVPQKDIPTLLRGFKGFLEHRKSSLSIVGDGLLKNELKELTRTLEIAEKVKWMGKINDVEDELVTWDLFLLTSKYEGFGMVLLEAMNCKVPIVASRNSAIVEVMGAEYPYLFETGNHFDLARVMLKAVSADPKWVNEYYQKRLNHFSVEKLLVATEETYEMAIK